MNTRPLFAPMKTLGSVLGQMATAFGGNPVAAPPKLADLGAVFAPPEDAFGYAPAESALPPKIVNFSPASDQGTFAAPAGPAKLKATDLLSAFPYPGQPGAVGTPQMGGTGNVGGDWAGVEQWSSQIQAAAQKYGVPVNLVKAIMKVESNGDKDAAGAQGVWGPMQVNGNVWGYGPWMSDPNANIDKGTEILKINYDKYGSWDMAIRAYLGFGTDQLGTTDQAYLSRVRGYWDQLNNASGGAGLSGATGGGTGGFSGDWSSLFGQGATVEPWGEMDRSDLPYYGYGTEYGLDGQTHTGLDVVMAPGTAMRSAFAGHVVCAGTDWGTGEDSCGAFGCSGFCPNGSAGRIEIMSNDGNTVLIYGHSSGSNVRPGQQVNAGDILGASGGMNSGHVHLEARVRDPSTPSGWRIVDPRTVLGSGFAGVVGQTGGGSAPASPGSFGRSLTQFAQNWRR